MPENPNDEYDFPHLSEDQKKQLNRDIDKFTRDTIWRGKLTRYEIQQYEPFVGHSEVHPYRGMDVLVSSPTIVFDGRVFNDAVFRVEDWYDRRAGESWNSRASHGPVIKYTGRIILIDTVELVDVGIPFPEDDEVVYGHWNMPGMPQNRIGDILHSVELFKVLTPEQAAKRAADMKELYA